MKYSKNHKILLGLTKRELVRGICSFPKDKEKSKNTTKCHNIFTIPLSSVMVNSSLILLLLFYIYP